MVTMDVRLFVSHHRRQRRRVQSLPQPFAGHDQALGPSGRAVGHGCARRQPQWRPGARRVQQPREQCVVRPDLEVTATGGPPERRSPPPGHGQDEGEHAWPGDQLEGAADRTVESVQAGLQHPTHDARVAGNGDDGHRARSGDEHASGQRRPHPQQGPGRESITRDQDVEDPVTDQSRSQRTHAQQCCRDHRVSPVPAGPERLLRFPGRRRAARNAAAPQTGRRRRPAPHARHR